MVIGDGMALVDYPSSDEDEDVQPTTPDPKATDLKRKRDDEASSELPPLPSKFHDLYASNSRVSTRDDPTLHGGRKRVTPHVEGNWPTHLYIEWYPATTEHAEHAEHACLTRLISKLKDSIPSDVNTFLTSDLGAPLPLHISLSRPIGFPTESKDAFVASMEQVVKSSGIRPFNVTFSGLDWVPNFEKTRWFLVLRLQEPESNGLNKLLDISNKVVQEYDQPPLYAKPQKIEDQKTRKSTNMKRDQNARRGSGSKMDWSGMQEVSDAFHISIAWALEPPSFGLLATTKSIAIDEFEDVKKISFGVAEMKAKVGNVVTNIPLPRNVVEEKALWGD